MKIDIFSLTLSFTWSGSRLSLIACFSRSVRPERAEGGPTLALRTTRSALTNTLAAIARTIPHGNSCIVLEPELGAGSAGVVAGGGSAHR